MSTHAGPNTIDTNVRIHLDAGNSLSYPGSGTTWTDLSGNGNTGTLTDGPTYSSTQKGILNFNGSTNYVIGTMPLISGPTTIEAVVKLNNVSSLQTIFTQGQNIISFSCGMVVISNNLRFRNNNNDYALSSPQTLSTGQWYHFVLTSGANGTVGYVNGISNGSTIQTITSNSVTTYNIGRRPASSTEFLNGSISFVKVYSVEVTQNDVWQMFNAVRGRYGI
jgi:hypothetical protein